MRAYRFMGPCASALLRLVPSKKIAVASAFLAMTVVPFARADILINFDNVANGTVVDTLYAGATFSNPLGGSIYARNAFLVSTSSQIVSVFSLGASPFGDFNAEFGAVDVVFATPQGRVSIDTIAFRNSGDAIGETFQNPFLEIYALVLGSYVEIPGSQQDYSEGLDSGEVGPRQTLAFTSPIDNIAKIRFSSQVPASPQVFAEFDNLTFAARDRASNQFPATADIVNPLANGPGGNVPEPTTLALLGIGIAGLGFARRKRNAS